MACDTAPRFTGTSLPMATIELAFKDAMKTARDAAQREEGLP